MSHIFAEQERGENITMMLPDPTSHPFYNYFLSGYLSKRDDPANSAPAEFPTISDNYEKVFRSALQALALPKESLKKRSEFDFDSCDTTKLESGIAVLRAVNALHLRGFHGIALIKPDKLAASADLFCEKNGHKVCAEVKAVTKQSAGRPGLFIVDQLFPKISESISKARRQLETSAVKLECTVRLFICVINWFAQSIHMDEADYQQVVNRLERDGDQELLKGIDGVFFITKMGEDYMFLNERGKVIDSTEERSQ